LRSIWLERCFDPGGGLQVDEPIPLLLTIRGLIFPISFALPGRPVCVPLAPTLTHFWLLTVGRHVPAPLLTPLGRSGRQPLAVFWRLAARRLILALLLMLLLPVRCPLLAVAFVPFSERGRTWALLLAGLFPLLLRLAGRLSEALVPLLGGHVPRHSRIAVARYYNNAAGCITPDVPAPGSAMPSSNADGAGCRRGRVKKMPFSEPPPPTSHFGSRLELSRVHWFRPELIVQVKYLAWIDQRFMRQVIYQGIREDKPSREVRRPGGLLLRSRSTAPRCG